MKKLLCRLLLMCILLAPSVSRAALYRDGTYTGYAKGMGTVTVTICIQNGRISSVEVSAPNETKGIADRPIQELPARILEANSIEGVEAISGATITSNAILKAALLCLNQASGGNLITPSPTPTSRPTPTPAPAPAVPHPEYQDGTYVAYANGIGTVTVTLTIEAGYITSVVASGPNETKGIGTTALEQMPARIIAANTIDSVDMVSSATLTSRAILQAAAQCLDSSVSGAASNAVQMLPSGLTEIQAEAFSECANLAYLLIPDSVKTIDASAFSGCINLTICTPSGSSAEAFANAQGIPVITY